MVLFALVLLILVFMFYQTNLKFFELLLVELFQILDSDPHDWQALMLPFFVTQKWSSINFSISSSQNTNNTHVVSFVESSTRFLNWALNNLALQGQDSMFHLHDQGRLELRMDINHEINNHSIGVEWIFKILLFFHKMLLQTIYNRPWTGLTYT